MSQEQANKLYYVSEKPDPRLLVASLTARDESFYTPTHSVDPTEVGLALGFLNDNQYNLIFGKYIWDSASLREVNSAIRLEFGLADDKKTFEKVLIDFVAKPRFDYSKESPLYKRIYNFLFQLEVSATMKLAKLLGIDSVGLDLNEIF